jgi:hypothetical protein
VYEIEITAEGLRHLNRLPEKVRHAALESIFGPISDKLESARQAAGR